MNFKSLPQLLDYLKDEKICIEYFEKIRWNEKPICPHCAHEKVYRTNRGFKCANSKCYKKFTVKVGTIFENSNISLRIWFAAIYLCTSHKKGISSLQLSRDLNISQKTAWFMLHRIREMLREKAPSMLKNTVQIDETYVGGKSKNKHIEKRSLKSQGRSIKDKTPVVGLLEKDGKVIAFVVKDTKASTLKSVIKNKVEKGSTIVTDAYRSYKKLDEDFTHIVVKHEDGKYIVDNQFHTQNIENFWSLFKRGIVGIYHYISPKHLQRYCEEFSARYNTRKISDPKRFNIYLSKTNGRLKYDDLIQKSPSK